MKQWDKVKLLLTTGYKAYWAHIPACDRYVQYLLAGANPSVLNRHRRGLQPWRCWPSISHSPIFPISGLHFPPKGPSSLQFNQVLLTKPKFKFEEPMTATWSSDHSAIYCGLILRLAIANDLSLATGFTRIDQKVILMQLGNQLNSYNLMHIRES
jgi:hypothetical protein